MMHRVLGLNEAVLKKCSVSEQAAYRSATLLFLLCMTLAIIGNACFGWFLLRNAGGVFLLALGMSFIHASVLHISLMTLMTRPLTEENQIPRYPADKRKKLFFLLFKNPLLKPVSLLRIIFVGCIAVSVSLPLSAMFFYEDAMQAENEYRNAFEQSHSSLSVSNADLKDNFRHSHFPFVIFRKLIQKPSCKWLFLLFSLTFFAPLLILFRLRHGQQFRYTHLLKSEMLKEVMIDYDETMEQMQGFVDRHYPEYNFRLRDLNAFADGPLRHKRNGHSQLSYGDKKAFGDFLNSL